VANQLIGKPIFGESGIKYLAIRKQERGIRKQ